MHCLHAKMGLGHKNDRIGELNSFWLLNQFYGPNLALNSGVDQGIFGKVTKHYKHDSQEVRPFPAGDHKATRNRHGSTTHTNMKHNKQKRSTKEAPPWNGQ